MRSISMSDGPLLELSDVGLSFNVDVQRAWTLRDWFVQGGRTSKTEHFYALKNVSFKVQPGERVGVLGVNGAGKTTLCRCIAGIYQPTTGKIQAPRKVRAAFHATVGIKPDLTGRENARLLSRFIYPDERDPRWHDELVDEALAFSELGEFIDRPYRTYSHGMQTRLSLSLISARPADLFILDEVFEGADQFFREKISARMMNTLERSGAALFVSHSQDQLRRVCTRLIVLERGQVIHDGAVAAGLARYEQKSESKRA